jgi:hypothetical protein
VPKLTARDLQRPVFLRRSQQTARSCRDIIGHILGSAEGYAPPDPAKFSSLPRTWAGRETSTGVGRWVLFSIASTSRRFVSRSHRTNSCSPQSESRLSAVRLERVENPSNSFASNHKFLHLLLGGQWSGWSNSLHAFRVTPRGDGVGMHTLKRAYTVSPCAPPSLQS